MLEQSNHRRVIISGDCCAATVQIAIEASGSDHFEGGKNVSDAICLHIHTSDIARHR